MNDQPQKSSLSIAQWVFLGALYGMQAWAIYWAVETSFVTFVRWAMRRHTAPPQPALFLGILLLIYLCAGGLLGAVAGSVVAVRRRANPRSALLAASTLTVLIVFAIATRQFLVSWKVPVLVVVMLLCIASAGAGVRARRLFLFGNPWVASLLALSAYVSYASGLSVAVSIGLFLLHAAAVIIGAMLWTRFARPAADSILPPVAATLAAALLLCGLSLTLSPAPIRSAAAKTVPPAGSPNIIVIVMDTVGAEHLSVYGYHRDTTPMLRAFAQQATVYKHSFSAGDMTLIAHASMFTGLYPAHHGAHYAADSPLGQPLAEKYQTLAEILAAKGYRTIGVVANDGYVSDQYGLAQGFDYYDQRPPRAPQRATPLYTLSGRILEIVSDRWPTQYFMRIARTAEEINEQVEHVLSDSNIAQRPFLLFLNYLDAHVPYVPPPPYDRLFPGKDGTLNKPRLDKMRWDLFTKHQPMSAAVHRHLVSQYDGAIAYLDAQLGRLFTNLKDKGLFDNSVVIVTSDHGEAFGEHGILNHGGMALYQSQISIPLLIKYPHQKTAAVVDVAVNTVDLLPTILDTLKYSIPAGLDGRSLLQIRTCMERAVVSESYPGGTAIYINPKRFGRTYTAVLNWPFKLIRPSAGSPELYDLGSDPGEQRNLYDPDDETALRLNKQFAALIHVPATKGKRPANTDADTYQRLKSLGYIQ